MLNLYYKITLIQKQFRANSSVLYLHMWGNTAVLNVCILCTDNTEAAFRNQRLVTCSYMYSVKKGILHEDWYERLNSYTKLQFNKLNHQGETDML
jgi:hypothetical protein